MNMLCTKYEKGYSITEKVVQITLSYLVLTDMY